MTSGQIKNPSNLAWFSVKPKSMPQEPESLNRHPFNLRSGNQIFLMSRLSRQRVVDTAFVAL